jgi:hypothetical protein
LNFHLCERQEVFHIEREPNGELNIRPIAGTMTGAISADIVGELYGWAEAEAVAGFFQASGSF